MDKSGVRRAYLRPPCSRVDISLRTMVNRKQGKIGFKRMKKEGKP